jgi:hypothetical protein
MFSRNNFRIIVPGLVLACAAISSQAQQTAYTWTDEAGVVHFSDRPPDETIESTTVEIEPAQAVVVPTVVAPVKTPDATTAKTDEMAPAPVETIEIELSEMSLGDLDQRCDDAREVKIAPLREAEIEHCKQDKRRDPDSCERINSDFGESGRTVTGSIRPRMFNDLPECLDAHKERNRRPGRDHGRSPG